MTNFRKSNPTHLLGLVVLALTLASLACGMPIVGGSGPTHTPSPTPPPQATPTPEMDLGDYGDAPDGDQGMEAGYYAPSGGPFLFTYEATGVEGNFPTLGENDIPGPFTLDVDEFWIGPLFGSTGSGDIPSLEDDADDPDDPDGPANLLINAGGADCDKENGAHNPSATGCSPQPAYSMPMNARLVILFGHPPLGMWMTSVTASDSMGYEGPVYWNLLFDLNQDGDWDGPGEWIAQDIQVDLAPGETETLISPAFQFPTSGSPWGRLNFPYWVRSMVTSESVEDTLGMEDYDGRGLEGGFEVGEVEDYFVEWRPLGPRYKDKEPAEAESCAGLSKVEVDELPSTRDAKDIVELIPEENVDEVTIFGLPDGEGAGTAVASEPLDVDVGISTTFEFGEHLLNVLVEERRIRIEPEQLGEGGARIAVLPQFGGEPPCVGSAPVFVTPGFVHGFQPQPRDIDGLYQVDSVFDSGDQSHGPFVKGNQIVEINVSDDGTIFTGPPPFVTVEGERNSGDGSFTAQGNGTVAGYAGIDVTFEGTLTLDGGLQGLYTMGSSGGLPGGQGITYAIEGQKAPEGGGGEGAGGSGPVPVTEGEKATIQSFIDVFNTSFQEGDAEPLFNLLHPAVLDQYGAETCRTYLGETLETPVELDYQNAVLIDSWDWMRDELTTSVNDAYRVQVNVTIGEESGEQPMHLVMPGDDSVRWFTDCGDPLE